VNPWRQIVSAALKLEWAEFKEFATPHLAWRNLNQPHPFMRLRRATD
jgi:hypothetical protein